MIYGIQHSGSMPAIQNCKRAFSSADGDFLIVPQEGILIITTEFGKVSILAILFKRTV